MVDSCATIYDEAFVTTIRREIIMRNHIQQKYIIGSVTIDPISVFEHYPLYFTDPWITSGFIILSQVVLMCGLINSSPSDPTGPSDGVLSLRSQRLCLQELECKQCGTNSLSDINLAAVIRQRKKMTCTECKTTFLYADHVTTCGSNTSANYNIWTKEIQDFIGEN